MIPPVADRMHCRDCAALLMPQMIRTPSGRPVICPKCSTISIVHRTPAGHLAVRQPFDSEQLLMLGDPAMRTAVSRVWASR